MQPAEPMPRPAWLPRAVVSGFIATLAMSMTFFVAYGAAYVLSNVELNPRNGALAFQTWMYALTHNPALDLHFTLMETLAMVLAVALLAIVVQDGETHWMEGILLLAVYFIFGLAFYHLPFAPAHSINIASP